MKHSTKKPIPSGETNKRSKNMDYEKISKTALEAAGVSVVASILGWYAVGISLLVAGVAYVLYKKNEK